MPKFNSKFAFFEVVAEELSSEPSRVITRAGSRLGDEDDPLFDGLKAETHSSSSEDAIRAAVDWLDMHFRGKGSSLPFAYDSESGRFTALDVPYLQFIERMKGIRTIGKRSQQFELEVMEKLRGRVTGSLHRVGDPRTMMPKKAEFNAYLKTLGFTGNVLLGKDRDGGFDILWLLPLGSKPHRPIVSVQCKNGLYDMGEGAKSVNVGLMSLGLHGRLQATVHVPCVLYNDYLFPERVTPKPMNFVPLGLTDLSPLTVLLTAEAI
ncbi:MAG: hypothetical protein ABSG60_04030 [Terracidiphilus sp.]|jgi:hypothetical protein